jgi:hypothetical protein
LGKVLIFNERKILNIKLFKIPGMQEVIPSLDKSDEDIAKNLKCKNRIEIGKNLKCKKYNIFKANLCEQCINCQTRSIFDQVK